MLGEGWAIFTIAISGIILMVIALVSCTITSENTFGFESFKNTTESKKFNVWFNVIMISLFLTTGFVFSNCFNFLSKEPQEDGVKVQEEMIEFYSKFNDNNNIYNALYEGKDKNNNDLCYHLILKNKYGKPYNKTVPNSISIIYENVEKPVYVVKVYEYRTFFFHKESSTEKIVFPLSWRNE